MASPVTTLEKPLQSWLSGWLSTQRLPTQFTVEPLAGDGSPRPFYRVWVGDLSFVLLVDPDWTLSKDYPHHQAYLAAAGVPVPRFHAVSPELGTLLMDDFGDELLQLRILANPAKGQGWLIQAVEMLAHLHGATYPVDPALPASSRKFDAQKYTQEMEFAYEHLVRGLLAVDSELPEPVRLFCQELEAFTPLVFCHRDFHTRNILVHANALHLIDFQDARLGPVEYDLASLFWDPYVPIPARDREDLLERYRGKLSAFELSHSIDWSAVPARLQAVGLQRMVKAAGSFASFFTLRGKRTHLPYLVPALETAATLQQQMSRQIFPLDIWIAKAKELSP